MHKQIQNLLYLHHSRLHMAALLYFALIYYVLVDLLKIWFNTTILGDMHRVSTLNSLTINWNNNGIKT